MIGILTFQRTTNYGALLQMWSLNKVLRDLGEEVEIIDYRNNAIEMREVSKDYSQGFFKAIIKKIMLGRSIKIKKINLIIL